MKGIIINLGDGLLIPSGATFSGFGNGFGADGFFTRGTIFFGINSGTGFGTGAFSSGLASGLSGTNGKLFGLISAFETFVFGTDSSTSNLALASVSVSNFVSSKSMSMASPLGLGLSSLKMAKLSVVKYVTGKK